MFKAVAGQSEGMDTREVSRAVIAQCREQLDAVAPTAGILFAAAHFDHALALKEIAVAFPGLELAGCTSSGEMSSAMGFSQDSMCLLLFASDTVSMAAGIGLGISKDPDGSVRHAVRDACSRLVGKPGVCLIFPGIFGRGITAILASAQESLGPGCKLFGGVPGADEFATDKIFQFYGESVHWDAVSILLFAGAVKVASVICHSWKPVGYRSVIEEADGNRVRRIGGRTALHFYREAFGPYTEPLPEMPLAIFDDNDRFYLRSIVSFDEKDESVEYATPLREGLAVQLTEATPRRITADLIDRLHDLMASAGADWSPRAALLFSCSSRRWILGLRTREELALARSVLPENIPIAGFYTFGEIAPLAGDRTPRLHNCTLVALLLGEDRSSRAADIGATRHHGPARQTGEELKLLAQKLSRAHAAQARLERQKESLTNIFRRMNADLTRAKQKIEEQNLILKESLTLAQEVQQNLIPDRAPEIDGFEIAGRSLYCDETGGDYIDYLPDRDGTAIVVGDVSDHGIAAALLMATARALLRMRASFEGAPVEFVTDLNRFLTDDVRDSGRFMTLIYLRLNSADRTVTWVRAGHDPGLRYNPDTGRFIELRGKGMALGVLDDAQFHEYTTSPLSPGEIILITTDGITETRNAKGILFGRERLMDTIRKNAGHRASMIVESSLAEVRKFREGLPRADDETLVVIKAR